jgi:hypothetical protein
MYKEVKNDLFNWGQLLTIISDFIVVISFILLGFVCLSMGLNSYPFIMSTAIQSRNSRRYFPTSLWTGALCWILHILSFFLVLTCFALGYMGRMLQKKRRIDFAFKLQKLTYVAIAVFNVSCIMILSFGSLLLSNVKYWIETCAETEKSDPKWDTCKNICLNPNPSSTIGSDKKFCVSHRNRLEIADKPISSQVMLVITILFAMLILTTLGFLMRNIFRSYRHKLELY